MTAMTRLVNVVAQGGPRMRYESMRDYFTQPQSPWLSLLLWSLMLGLVCVVLLLAVKRSRRGGGTHVRPWTMFLRLLWRAPLNWGQRWLLWRLARAACPAHPAAVLMTPDALRRSAELWAKHKQIDLSHPSRAEQFDRVAKVLFGCPLKLGGPAPGGGGA